ncbi:hypothetical protein FBU59_005596 [Linderina macrospora]|uniref:Uncharacterized protein n=1 Tax=Linderina macrospora TaxID=4868 RepID=A0ACC1J2H2_9FUNG|nr:hypothetical protein FBU59_005596 [Linderina macrospora]
MSTSGPSSASKPVEEKVLPMSRTLKQMKVRHGLYRIATELRQRLWFPDWISLPFRANISNGIFPT